MEELKVKVVEVSPEKEQPQGIPQTKKSRRDFPTAGYSSYFKNAQ